MRAKIVNIFIFNDLIWRITALLAWPHLWIQRRRMQFIVVDDGYQSTP